jgi:hypothetical protein
VTIPAPRRLHIGIDAEKVVVAPRPLTMRTGRAHRRTTGSVTEVTPVPGSGRSRADRVRFAARLALPLLVLGAVPGAFGLPWWAGPAVAAAVVALVARAQSRAARTGLLAVPAGDAAHVLVAQEERAAYERAVVVSRRIRRTWPALGDLVDPADADRTLTRALTELAALMARRQQIRRLRTELRATRPGAVPADSPAVLALAAQRERVERLWRATGAQANRMLRSIDDAALAGESLIREQRLQQTAREAERAITRLALTGPVPVVEAGPELAERTAAVVAAYRELGTGV